MYYIPYMYPYHYHQYYHHQHHPYYMNVPMHHWDYYQTPIYREKHELKDHGKKPYVVNINEATKQNNTYRTAIWTGDHLQVTLMSLHVGEDIGLEMHPHVDQFLRLEQGHGIVQMGNRKDHLDFVREVNDDSAIFIPAGTWHNLTNTGNIPLKLYSIYAPPNHPFGTVHKTKKAAMEAEHEHH
ncbi:cupin domain-containing protein [Bacillus sp. REN16]|uniref:cupin domain-containing protein n=1 Tax=Bacillus sp. REN16 TaxID=2887296 RepID=UPI001E3D05A0|nr:cupin domain-containing protein [Bacillus sp. REN16]MCC3357907.1 cupin domain-containing protein [Bacillus sp. REN16]